MKASIFAIFADIVTATGSAVAATAVKIITSAIITGFFIALKTTTVL